MTRGMQDWSPKCDLTVLVCFGVFGFCCARMGGTLDFANTWRLLAQTTSAEASDVPSKLPHVFASVQGGSATLDRTHPCETSL